MTRKCMFTSADSNETRFVSREKAAASLRSYRRNAFVRKDQNLRGAYWLISLFNERHHLDTMR